MPSMAIEVTIDELMPELAGAGTVKEVCRRMFRRGLSGSRYVPLAREACARLGMSAADNTLSVNLSPSQHTDRTAADRRLSSMNCMRRRRENSETQEIDRTRSWSFREKNPDYWTRRRRDVPSYALRVAVAGRINAALRKSVGRPGKAGPTLELLGCTADQYRIYLEGLFEPGMSWQNWASDGWHIDHVRPLASFDLDVPAEQRAAFHYSNTRPMWAKENLRKSSTWNGVRRTYSEKLSKVLASPASASTCASSRSTQGLRFSTRCSACT